MKMFSVIVGTDELHIDSDDQGIMFEYVFNETEPSKCNGGFEEAEQHQSG